MLRLCGWVTQEVLHEVGGLIMSGVVTWLELVGCGGAPEWVLHRRDRRDRHQVVARMPAPPAMGRSPQQLLAADGMHVWVARHMQASSVDLCPVEGGASPAWRVRAKKLHSAATA